MLLFVINMGKFDLSEGELVHIISVFCEDEQNKPLISHVSIGRSSRRDNGLVAIFVAKSVEQSGALYDAFFAQGLGTEFKVYGPRDRVDDRLVLLDTLREVYR